jgi:DNA primase catalytic core
LTTAEVVEEIRCSLKDYLAEHGHFGEVGRPINCPIVGCDHKGGADSTLSATLNQVTVHCNKNKITWNIFDFAEAWDDLPKGRDERFYTETIPTLADHFGFEYDKEELTPAQKKRYRYHEAYRDAVEIISADATAVECMISHRSFAMADISVFQLGAITDRQKYFDAMATKGWTDKKELEDPLYLSQSYIFREDALLIPVQDELGRTVAVVARHTKPNGTLDKYMNPTTANTMYKKAKILFNFHRAVKEAGPLWIVEGYLDAVAMHVAGCKKVMSTCAAGMTREQMDLLYKHKCHDIILCLDEDSGGIAGTGRAIDVLSTKEEFKVRVVELPDGVDPEEYLRTHTFEDMTHLPTRSAFEWVLNKRYPSPDRGIVHDEIVPLIAMEPSPLIRGGMIASVERHSGLPHEDIKDDVVAFLDRESAERRSKEKRIIDTTFRAIAGSKDPLADAQQMVYDLKDLNRDRKGFDVMSVKGDISDQCEALWHDNKPGIAGYSLPGYPIMQKVLDGFPRGTCLMTVGALPGVGKSTFARNVMWDLAVNNDDVQCLYMTIDDSMQLATKAFIAQISGLEIEELTKFRSIPEEEEDRIQAWHNAFKTWKAQTNMIPFDTMAGRSIHSLELQIESCLKINPHLKPVVFVDNFHILDGVHNVEIRQRTIENVKSIKHLSVSYDIPICMIVQLNKGFGDRRPLPSDIQESAQVEFESEIVMMLHSEMKVKPKTTNFWTYVDRFGVATKMPIMEAFVWKNKYGQYQSLDEETSLYYRINRYTSRMNEMDYSELPHVVVEREAEEEKLEKEGWKDK